ncbi:MAG: hypothetical protein WBC04_10540, partial [Candidatus Acidiferrales bacterium]
MSRPEQRAKKINRGGHTDSVSALRWAQEGKLLALATALALGLAATALADRTHLKPGFNLFSPDQDVAIGRKSAEEAEKQL